MSRVERNTPKLLLINRQDYSCKLFDLPSLKTLLKNRFLDDFFIVIDYGYNKVVHFTWRTDNPMYSLSDLERDFKKFLLKN